MSAPAAARTPGDLLCLLTTGRTGSTLLQRLLNLHERVVVFGEHNAIVGPLGQLWDQIFHSWARDNLARAARLVPDMLASRPVLEPDGASIEWANAFTEETGREAFRHFLEELLFPPGLRPPGMRYWGFKEIRYGPPAAEFLAGLFPAGRFIVLLRDPLAIHRSRLATGYWYPRLDAAAAAALMHREFQALCDVWDRLSGRADAAERVRLLDYGALLDDPEAVLAGIAGWTGLEPFDRGRVATVLAGEGRSGEDADPARSAAFMAAYEAGPASADVARWRALVGPAPA